MRPNKPWTLNEITNFLQDNNATSKLLSESYKHQGEKLDWECKNCQTLFNRSWKIMLQTIKGEVKGGCPTCTKRVTYTIDDVKAKLKADKRPIISLESTYSNNKAPMKWQCTAKKCGHIWTNNWKAVNGVGGLTPQGCQKCYENNPQYSIAELKAKLIDQNINAELLTKTYKNLKFTKLKFKCLNSECGHIWDTKWSNIYDAEKGCPVCCNNGLTERGIKRFLDKIFGAGTFIKIKPSFLINPKTGFPLEIDCYSEKLNLAIEIQGEQHYKYNKFFHRTQEKFINQIEKDRFKKQSILNQGIKFIELDISNKEKIAHIKETLKKELIKCNIKVPKKYDLYDIQRYHKDGKNRIKRERKQDNRTLWTIKTLKEKVKKTSFKPLFSKYTNHREVLKWECKKCGYIFNKSWMKIIFKIQNQLQCKKCTQIKNGYNLKKVIETIKIKKIPLACLSKEYTNGIIPLKWKCLEPLCNGEFNKDWTSVNRSSKGSCIYCSLNLKRNVFLLNYLNSLFGKKKVEVLKLPIIDQLKHTEYQVFYLADQNLVVELDNWYDNEFFSRYHKDKKQFKLQQQSKNKKDKYLKEKGFIHIKIELKADIHFYDIERKLKKILHEKNINF